MMLPRVIEGTIGDLAQCQNCDWQGDQSEAVPVMVAIPGRVSPGEIAPAGECPECGCLATPLSLTELCECRECGHVERFSVTDDLAGPYFECPSCGGSGYALSTERLLKLASLGANALLHLETCRDWSGDCLADVAECADSLRLSGADADGMFVRAWPEGLKQ